MDVYPKSLSISPIFLTVLWYVGLVVQGEKLLGSLGGVFSKTWKPKKGRKITGPMIGRGKACSCNLYLNSVGKGICN